MSESQRKTTGKPPESVQELILKYLPEEPPNPYDKIDPWIPKKEEDISSGETVKD